MCQTSAPMLLRLRQTADSRTWQCFVRLYTPLFHRWLAPCGLYPQDVEDIIQETFAAVARNLPRFHHNQRRGAFRCWLKTILVNQVHAFRRSQRHAGHCGETLTRFAGLVQDSRNNPSRLFELQHKTFVVRRALQRVEPQFRPAAWLAFTRLMLEQDDPETVASELGLSIGALYQVKSRIMKRLREELGDNLG